MQVASLHETMIALRARRRSVRMACSIMYPPIYERQDEPDDLPLIDDAPIELPRVYSAQPSRDRVRHAVLACLTLLLLAILPVAILLLREVAY